VVADDTAAGECLVPGPGKLGYLGVGGFAWDAKGNLYFTTDDQAGLYGSSAIPYAIYQCDTACLYGPTFTAPVLIFNEPDSATPKTTGQLFIGAIAFDPWGNLWFTDAAALGTGGNILYSDLNELAYTATSKTFSSTPTVVKTLTNSPASNNEIDALVVSTTPSTSNVKSYKIYIGIANSGIFALNDNNGVADQRACTRSTTWARTSWRRTATATSSLSATAVRTARTRFSMSRSTDRPSLAIRRLRRLQTSSWRITRNPAPQLDHGLL